MRCREVSDMRGLISFLTFLFSFLAISAMPDRALAQSEAVVTRNFPWEGEVTGTSVYIRSGAGGNYYPTTKVGPGTRLLVVGEKFGWYEIVPPIGSFSYIDQSLVEKSEDGKTGTVTQENVYVRAGSDIERRKTSTQMTLAKGATVSILGDADGFLKIVPPRGANLFISAQYVAPVPERTRSGLLEKFMSEGGPVSSSVTPSIASAPPIKKTGKADAAVKPVRADSTVAVKTTEESPRSINTDTAILPPDESITSTSADNGAPVSVDVGRAPIATPRSTVSANVPPREVTPSRPVSESGTSAWIESQFPSNDGSQPAPRPAYTSHESNSFSSASPAQSREAISSPSATPSPFATSPPSNAKTVDGRNITTIEVTAAPGTDRYGHEVQLLEAEMQSELRKPIMEQKLAGLRDRFGPISIQNEDQVAKEIAKIRIRQLNDRINLQSSRMALAAESKELDAYRKRSDEERIAIARRVASYSTPPSYDVVGELRRSSAFGPEKRRYRLVNPKSGTTIGYVDVPSSITTNVDQWVGQMVGVKAAGKNYSNAARMTFYVAESITPIGGDSGGAVDQNEPNNDAASDEGIIEFTESAPVAKPAMTPQPTAKPSPITPAPMAKPATQINLTPQASATPQPNVMPKPIAADRPAPQPVKPAAPTPKPVAKPSNEPIMTDDPAGQISFSSPTPTFSSGPATANRPADISGGSTPAPAKSSDTGNTPADEENTSVEPLEPLN